MLTLKPYLTLICLLSSYVLGVALEAYVLALLFALAFLGCLSYETKPRRKLYLALASAGLILTLAPIHTDLNSQHFLTLGLAFGLSLAIPTWLLRHETPKVIEFRFLPKHIDKVDVIYTLLALPLAYLAFKIYFHLSPEVPFNWSQPLEPDNAMLLKLFLGINAVGIWDELFFINICYAILRRLFPYPQANYAQAVIYTSILWDMAFRGLGPMFIYIFALTQGAMYERSKVLLWVLVVHMLVDYVLFQAIVSAHYPNLDIWWH